MTEAPERRYVVLAEGRLRAPNAKTAHGLIRYGKDPTLAVIDSTLNGQTVLEAMPDLRNDAPIVATIEEALDYNPTSLLVGVAPPGGRLPEDWMRTIRTVADSGVEIVSGLHQRLAPLFPDAKVWDVREPPKDIPLFSGEGFGVEPKVALTVGTSSAIGKMTATLEIERAAREANVSTEFVATGQTGIIIAGWGTSVDAVVSDFVAGSAEQLVLQAARSSPEIILVEGQGSLGHPAYSGVTLGLLHGSCPDCLVLCCDALDERIMGLVPRPNVSRMVRLYEETAALVKPAPVVSISVNTRGLNDEEAEEFVERMADETGLPTADPLRGSVAGILDAILGV
ncbi:MAG: DUF1611 domain-containing protein [Actinomycetota bacterium]|nr:DUF1611 domain-containing protein [Actinomycetota bacterium]